jgi:hypothetical protein
MYAIGNANFLEVIKIKNNVYPEKGNNKSNIP